MSGQLYRAFNSNISLYQKPNSSYNYNWNFSQYFGHLLHLKNHGRPWINKLAWICWFVYLADQFSILEATHQDFFPLTFIYLDWPSFQKLINLFLFHFAVNLKFWFFYGWNLSKIHQSFSFYQTQAILCFFKILFGQHW